MNFKKIKLLLLIPLIFIIISWIPKLLNLWVDYLWFKEVGYEAVFTKTLLSKFAIGGITFIVIFLLISLTLSFTLKKKSNVKIEENDNVIDIKETSNKGRRSIIFTIAFIIAALLAILTATNLWENILIYLNTVSFGSADPVFNKDISFYTFHLSLYEAIYSFVLLFFFVIAFINVLLTLFMQGIGKTPLKLALKQFGYYFVTFFLLLAVGYRLKMFNLLFASHDSFFGAGYTDLNVTLPYYYLAIVTCILASILMFIGIKKKSNKLLVFGPLLLVIVIFLGGISQTMVQKFIVQPNEIRKEEPYIKRNIEMTNEAFGLDKIKQVQYSGDADLTPEDLEKSQDVINNIRINDVRPARIIYNQLQSMRPYYSFSDVDIDRYKLDGVPTQVFLSAREINQNDLPEQAKTWINKYLKFTHGYGAVVTPANVLTPQGQPYMIVKDIPPKTEIPELKIDRPEIYYGNYTNDYVFVNTDEKEFDYPSGSNNVETTYEGDAGIPLSGLNKALFALNKGNFRILISGALNSDSRILMHRNIEERVKKIAPFFTYDDDPYLVIDKGNLYWIIDAFTASSKYPYSQPIATQKWYKGINYIRNSVKVVVNAYNGETNFYLIDSTDPIAKSYSKVFPNLLKPASDMPEGLKDHLRYPVDYFDIQTRIYQDYHMSNPRVFYNREDAWNIAKEIYQTEAEGIPVEPFFVNMKFPDSDKLEFVLMRPYTPIRKDQMVGWLGARNDGENYGELVLFRFSKQKLVYGPMQIESRIDSDSDISKELSLWNQKGSKVLRGNLLVIPINNSILYVEPLYIQADNQNSLPEVKRIIVAYKDTIVMEETLDKALLKIFGERIDKIEKDVEITDTNLESLIKEASNTFKEAKKASQGGNWAEYGEALNRLENILQKLDQEKENKNENLNTTTETNETL